MKDLILHRSVLSGKISPKDGRLTQLELGSKNRHQTPSVRIASMRRHRFKNTANMRLRRSMICWSCFALVGLAA